MTNKKGADMDNKKDEELDIKMENATEAIGNVTHVVEYQRKVEKRNIIIISLIITILVLAIFVIDSLQLLGFFMLVLPIVLLAVGLFLIGYSIHLVRQKHPYKLTLLMGILSLSYPLALCLLFFFAIALGLGPVPN